MEGGGLLAKFYGAIGYALLVESSPGIWIDSVVEKNYRGDVVLNQMRFQSGEAVNDNIDIDNSISIVADAYAYENLGFMKYLVWNKVAWRIKSFSVNRPRIVLQIGGVYNGERPSVTP
jgi:hypothetical protein